MIDAATGLVLRMFFASVLTLAFQSSLISCIDVIAGFQNFVIGSDIAIIISSPYSVAS